MVDAGDLCRFLCSLPGLSRQAIVEVHFVPLIFNPKTRTTSLHSGVGIVPARQADADSLGSYTYAAGMLRIVVKQEPGLAAPFAIDIDVDRIGVVSRDVGQRRAICERFPASRENQATVPGLEPSAIEVTPELPVQIEFGRGEFILKVYGLLLSRTGSHHRNCFPRCNADWYAKPSILGPLYRQQQHLPPQAPETLLIGVRRHPPTPIGCLHE